MSQLNWGQLKDLVESIGVADETMIRLLNAGEYPNAGSLRIELNAEGELVIEESATKVTRTP